MGNRKNIRNEAEDEFNTNPPVLYFARMKADLYNAC